MLIKFTDVKNARSVVGRAARPVGKPTNLVKFELSIVYENYPKTFHLQ